MFRSTQQNHTVSHIFENELARPRGGSCQLDLGGPSSEQQQQEQQQQQQQEQQQQQPNQCPKKRTYRCIRSEKIRELDAFFKLNDHPNQKERIELGNRLELEPAQIKFWFQNRRNKLKGQSQRQENQFLKAENEILRAENEKLQCKMNIYKETPVTCNCCGTCAIPVMPNEQHQLRHNKGKMTSMEFLKQGELSQ